MELKDIQELAPWLAELSLPQKLLISVIVISVAAFFLAMVWVKPPPDGATQAILSGCYRRALFTRTHRETDLNAMFSSISACRQIVQTNIPNMKHKKEQAIAVQLLAQLDGIERIEPRSIRDYPKIDAMKLQALHNFRELVNLSGGSYALPEMGKLGFAFYFTQEEADEPLSMEDISRGNSNPNPVD